MQSNLILDYVFPSTGSETTLRQLLLGEYPNRLPPLNHPQMANTLGVATLVIYRNGGIDVPHIVVRTQTVAVFNTGSAWHCTSSYAAKWEDSFLTSSGTFAEIIEPYLWVQLKQEVGLTQECVTELRPVALCRELIRGGKPQLFCIAKTTLSCDELESAVTEARRVEKEDSLKKQKEFRPEVEKMPIFRVSPQNESLDSIEKKLTTHNVTPEAAALLWYWVTSRKPA